MQEEKKIYPRRQRLRSICDEISEIDRDIIRFLIRRYNLLCKIRGDKKQLLISDEKKLRRAFTEMAGKVSRDPRLSKDFFDLLQDISFLPWQVESEEIEERPAFNLAPPQRPIEMAFNAPLSSKEVRSYLFLTMQMGQKAKLDSCLVNDSLIDFIMSFNKLGAGLSREDENSVICRDGKIPEASDSVIYVGSDIWNFYLLLAFYIGKFSRVKLTGDGILKNLDCTQVEHFIPNLGSRLVHMVPKSINLPVRIECSGILPESIIIPEDVPSEFIEALLLASPFYNQDITYSFSDGYDCSTDFKQAISLLKAFNCDINIDDKNITIKQSKLKLPKFYSFSSEEILSIFILAFPLVLGGEINFKGLLPKTESFIAALDFLRFLGLTIKEIKGKNIVIAKAKKTISEINLDKCNMIKNISNEIIPLIVAMCAITVLKGGRVIISDKLNLITKESIQFFDACSLEIEEDKIIYKESLTPSIYNAPSSTWAFAYALCACARKDVRKGFSLGNPSIMSSLYPNFWNLYNALPNPEKKQKNKEIVQDLTQEKVLHRRIITN